MGLRARPAPTLIRRPRRRGELSVSLRAGPPGPRSPASPPAFPGRGPPPEVGRAGPGLRGASPASVLVRWSERALCAHPGRGDEFVRGFGPRGVCVGESSRETLFGSGGVFSLSNPSCEVT